MNFLLRLQLDSFCKEKQKEIIGCIINNAETYSQIDEHESTIIHWALISGNYGVINRHSKNKYLLNKKNTLGETPLDFCLRNWYEYDYVEKPHVIIENLKLFEFDESNGKNNGLHIVNYCAKNNKSSMLDNVLKIKKYNIYAHDESGRSAMTLAIDYGIVKNCSILIKNGFNLLHKDNNGRYVFLNAIQSGYQSIFDIFIRKSIKDNIIESLKSIENQNGSGAAHIACLVNSTQIFKTLIKYKFDIDKKNHEGIRPVNFLLRNKIGSFYKSSIKIIKMMHENDVNFNLDCVESPIDSVIDLLAYSVLMSNIKEHIIEEVLRIFSCLVTLGAYKTNQEKELFLFLINQIDKDILREKFLLEFNKMIENISRSK